eukprot:4548565-Karenia_brevis.AAC.1
MSNLGVTAESKGVAQPGAKMDNAADVTLLPSHEVAQFKSNVMRLAYLAQDRLDIKFASKELARCMQAPNRWDFMQLKRVVRYLKN